MPHQHDQPEPSRLSPDEARLTEEQSLQRCPLGSHWPDWRVLNQTATWFGPDLLLQPVDDLSPEGADSVLMWLYTNAATLHAQAATASDDATSIALRWLLDQARIPSVRETPARLWLASMPLVRHLNTLLDDLAQADPYDEHAGA